MVWLYRSPIPVGRRRIVYSFKLFFYLPSMRLGLKTARTHCFAILPYSTLATLSVQNVKRWSFLSNMFYATKNNKTFKFPKSKDDLAWIVSLFLLLPPSQIKILTVWKAQKLKDDSTLGILRNLLLWPLHTNCDYKVGTALPCKEKHGTTPT